MHDSMIIWIESCDFIHNSRYWHSPAGLFQIQSIRVSRHDWETWRQYHQAEWTTHIGPDLLRFWALIGWDTIKTHLQAPKAMGGYSYLSALGYARYYKAYFHQFLVRKRKLGGNFALLGYIYWRSLGNIAILWVFREKFCLYRGINRSFYRTYLCEISGQCSDSLCYQGLGLAESTEESIQDQIILGFIYI